MPAPGSRSQHTGCLQSSRSPVPPTPLPGPSSAGRRRMAHLFPAHFGQFVQVNVDAVEPDAIGGPTLGMQDLLHQHVEEELDAAEETRRVGAWAPRRPPLPAVGTWHAVRAAARPARAPPWGIGSSGREDTACHSTRRSGRQVVRVARLRGLESTLSHCHTAGLKATTANPDSTNLSSQPFRFRTSKHCLRTRRIS